MFDLRRFIKTLHMILFLPLLLNMRINQTVVKFHYGLMEKRIYA